MDGASVMFYGIIKGFAFLGLLAAGFGAVALIITYIFDDRNIREENSHLSTSVGNALLVLHQILQPSGKPKTEQVIWLKKKRTPLEKKLRTPDELEYDNRCIRGCKRIPNKRYRLKL